MDRFFETFRKGDTFNVGINGGIIECTFVRSDGTSGIIEVTDRAGVFAILRTDHLAFISQIEQVRDGEPT
jgi:hypothetical protein